MQYNGKIIDFHTHIQPSEVISDRTRYCAEEQDFNILYEDPASALAGSADLLKAMDSSGVRQSVILGFAWRNPLTLRLHNDTILAAAEANSDRFIPFTCVYPFDSNSGAEAERCFELGAAGIGEVGLYDRDIDAEYIESMKPVMKICLDRGKPLMLHVNEPIGHPYCGKAPITIRGIYNFVKAFPENRIILAHWGGGLLFFASLKKEVKKVLKNVWFDTAASPYLYDPSIWNRAAELIGADRILFGTDYPLLAADRYLSEAADSGLNQDELERIFYRNAEEVLG